MRYSPQQRKAFGEAFNYINGRDALLLVASPGAARPEARRTPPRKRRKYRKSRASYTSGHWHGGATPASVCLACGGLGIVLALAGVSIWLGLWAISKMSSLLLGKMRRPQYYPQERSRRKRLARERRRVRDRFTTAPCPEPEQLLAQYAKAKTGAREALIFGSMLCDLEAYCDNSLIRNVAGEIAGRNPGMKGWIRDNCPELQAHYKNAMRYKGLAEKFRQATGAADPVSATALAADDDGEIRKLLEGKQVHKITVRMRKANGPRRGNTVSGTYALDAETLEAARKTAREILGECERKNVDRLRCGKIASKSGRGKEDTGKDAARLRRGMTSGGVARLEEILDERLDGVPEVACFASRWRVREATERGTEASGTDLASA